MLISVLTLTERVLFGVFIVIFSFLFLGSFLEG